MNTEGLWWEKKKKTLQNQMDTGSSIGAITYKLWEHYLTSLKLVFLMSKMEMAIISRLKYFRKKCKRCEFARELGTQKVPSFSFFFSVKKWNLEE